ncbi:MULTISPECIES: ABC transporter substrate-binding protein [unclassified Burkholderia]|uniref:ABC transporter substrate-binding protein n=1 Tax=unclassified Burkholderia TaxID=2613784 RepID=UPI000AB73B3A|nr:MULTISPECIES: ABC transporter substrate-binding protein [unclassified Burkholderia]
MKGMAWLLSVVTLSVAWTGVNAETFKTIRFGVEPSYPPFESKAPDGKLVGFDIDLGEAICAKLHAKCVWVENTFDGMFPALQARKFDAINSSMSVNEKRLKQIDFTDKLYHPAARLVVRVPSTLLTTPESLRGKRVGVQQGTTMEAYAKTYWAPKGIDVVSYATQDQVWADLTSGRLDAALCVAVQADQGFLKTPQGRDFGFAKGPTLNDPAIFGVGISIGVRKDDPALRDALNGAIRQIRADGTYDRIAKKYFSFDIYGG